MQPLQVFLGFGETCLLRKGKNIITGKELDGVYYVVQGSISVEVFDELENFDINGKSCLLYSAGKGDIIGIEGILSVQSFQYLLSPEVDSCVVHIKRAQVKSALQALTPEQRMNAFEALLRQVSDRVVEMSRSIACREFRKVEDRVYLALLEILKQGGGLGNSGRKVLAPRARVAKLARCSREMVTFALNGLTEKGLVKVLKGSIVEVLPVNHLAHVEQAQLAAQYGLVEQALTMPG